MAVLTPSQSHDYLPPCPAGTFGAICVDVKDQFQVQRRKYQSEELETVNLTTFTFQFQDGDVHQVRTKAMLISANEKSALIKFLTQWLGAPPKMGWDYCEMKGMPALINVSHTPRQNGEGVFCNIASIMPLPKGMQAPAVSSEAPADEPVYDENGDIAFGPDTPEPAPVAPPPAPKTPPRAPAAAPKAPATRPNAAPVAPKAPAARPTAPAARRPAAPPPPPAHDLEAPEPFTA